ncbi:MAG: hypothetical protein MJ041_04520, partial [Acidaminococcaceae bacterium]|nr:hypothetical protein [Acidaminococcaceae bacterium]
METGTLAVDILKATSGTAGATATATTGGTTYLKADASATTPAYQVITVNSDRKIEGTLDGSGSTIKMTGDNAVKTLTIDTLTGTTNLEIDVDMSNFTADKLAVGTITGATVNVKGINITKDITPTTLELPKEEDSKITFVSDQAGTGTVGTGGTYKVNDPAGTGTTAGQIVLTNNYKYTFSKGTTDGTLKYKVEAGYLTFKKFVEGTLPGYMTDPATLSMTADLANTGINSDIVNMETDQSNTAITVNLNGHKLTSGQASIIIIRSGKTFKLNCGSAATDGTVNGKTGVSVA